MSVSGGEFPGGQCDIPWGLEIELGCSCHGSSRGLWPIALEVLTLGALDSAEETLHQAHIHHCFLHLPRKLEASKRSRLFENHHPSLHTDGLLFNRTFLTRLPPATSATKEFGGHGCAAHGSGAGDEDGHHLY